MTQATLHLRPINRLSAFTATRQAVMDFLAPAVLSERVSYSVDLVLEEAFMNIVMHAHDDGQPHPLDLHVAIDDAAVTLQFEDDGRPFDPLTAADPARPTSIEETTTGGLGLGLLRRHASAIAYAREAGRNCLTVTIARH